MNNAGRLGMRCFDLFLCYTYFGFATGIQFRGFTWDLPKMRENAFGRHWTYVRLLGMRCFDPCCWCACSSSPAFHLSPSQNKTLGTDIKHKIMKKSANVKNAAINTVCPCICSYGGALWQQQDINTLGFVWQLPFTARYNLRVPDEGILLYIYFFGVKYTCLSI